MKCILIRGEITESLCDSEDNKLVNSDSRDRSVIINMNGFGKIDNEYNSFEKNKKATNVASRVIQIFTDSNNFNVNNYLNFCGKNKEVALISRDKNVTLIVRKLLTDYNKYNIRKYINISVDSNNVEEATVTLMVRDWIDTPALHREPGSIPGSGASTFNDFKKDFGVIE